MNRILVLTLTCASIASARETPPSAEQVRFFETKVRPLLVEHCQQCHGPKKQQGGLRLDSAAGFRAGGDNGALVTPGKPETSLLLRALRHEGPKMPPKKQLASAEIATLTEWVKMGAPWPEAVAVARNRAVVTDADRAFWAFQPVRDPAVPVVQNPRLALTPIDHFLLHKLEAKNLSFSPLADRRTLLRRVTYDLTGLPPTPEEVQAFLDDRRDDAYARVVDRLLASPAYGERWGRHWLDVVRYADTAGDNSDYPVPQLYKYRNWVIEAFNRDLPFDAFVQQQLAGDLMPADSREETNSRLIATGYVANARRYGSYEDKRYQWYLTFEDTIENLGRSFLGLSLACARCHDHKFDPIPSEDYYSLYGFFQSTRFPWPGTELDKVPRDLVPLDPSDKVTATLAARDAKLAEFDAKIREAEKREDSKRAVAELRKQRERFGKEALPLDFAYAVIEGKRWVGNAKMQMRGDPTKLGREAPRRFLQVLGGQTLPAEAVGSGRLQLAQWVSDAKNPLTSRVLVNRLWLHHFGKGLVPTPNDFGKQGQPPTHPELLDWLATRFVESGWSIKAMHRLMVTSRAYQTSSGEGEAESALFGSYVRRRLDAEAIRDTLMQLGEVLDRSVGGPHPFPDQTTWDFTQHKPFKAFYDTDRRSVYMMTPRIQRHPYLALFDGPDTNASTAKRDSSTTPLQALYLLNDPLVGRLATAFAGRLMREASSDQKRVERSFLLAFARPATAEEVRVARDFLAAVRDKVAGQEELVWRSYVRGLFLSNELVYVE